MKVSLRNIVMVAAVVAAGSLAFGRVVENDFAWDDGYLVLKNDAIRDLSHIPGFFSHTWAHGASYKAGEFQNRAYYRPIAQTSMALDYAIAGPNPLFFHAVNLFLHMMAAIAVLCLLGRAVRLVHPGASWWTILFPGLLFAVHPVHSESIALVSYRTTLLSGLFTFAGLLVLWHPDRPSLGLWRNLAGAGLYLLACLAKETGAIMPALLFLMDAGSGARPWKMRRLTYLALACVGAGYLLLRWSVTGPGMYDFFAGLSAMQKALMVGRIFFLYVRLCVLPVPLCPFYDWTVLGAPSSLAEPDVLAGFALLAAFLLATASLWRRASLVASGIALFLVGLLPVSHLVPFFDAVAERFLYVPMLGLVMVLAVALSSAHASDNLRGRTVVPAFLALVAMFALLSHKRMREWHSSESILLAFQRDFPQSLSARMGLGRLYLRQGKTAAAVPQLRVAVRIAPRLAAARGLLVVALARAGRVREARKVLMLSPPAPPRSLSAAQIVRGELARSRQWRLLRLLGLY